MQESSDQNLHTKTFVKVLWHQPSFMEWSAGAAVQVD